MRRSGSALGCAAGVAYLLRRAGGWTLPLLLLALVGCRPPEPPRSRPPLAVSVAPVWDASFGDVVDTVSTLEAVEEVQLAAQASGRIQQLLVRQGDRVRAGQLLLVLDQTQARAEVARLRAEMATKRLNDQRYDWLVRQGAASAYQRDEFRQQYLSAREELAAREADLGFRDLRAPIGGTVADLQVKQGDLVQTGTPFTRIVRDERLLARIDVPAIHATRLRVGLPVQLLDPVTEQPMAAGTLRSMDPAVSPATQVLLAKAEFENSAGNLRPGLRLRTRLLLEQRRQPSVPFAAVTTIAGQSFVYVMGTLTELERNPGKADLKALKRLPPTTTVALQTPVRLGAMQNNRYPVLGGLQPGQEVITSSLINLRHGQPVRLVPSP